jgi:NADPH:quinone reductase
MSTSRERPSEMRLIRTLSSGELAIQHAPTPLEPESGSHQVLVEVTSFGINRADLLQRAGHYPAPFGVPQDVLGLEFAGRVIATAPQLDPHRETLWQVGDRVMGICGGGGYVEFISVDERTLLPAPSHLTDAECAGLPEVCLTAYDALTARGHLRAGERILIHAVGSGVGLAAARLAHLMGAEVIGTSRAQWKLDRAKSSLPLSEGWLSEEGLFLPTEARGSIDVIIDFVGGAYLKENLSALRTGGRLVIVGLLGGIKGEMNLGALLSKRAQVIGTVLRSRSLEEKIELTQNWRDQILPALLSGRLDPPEIFRVYDASAIEQAHSDLLSNQVWSKLVCAWDVNKQ